MHLSKILLFIFIVFSGSLVFAQNDFKRIVSLAPSLTEELCQLGAADKIIGITTYCTRPEYIQEKEKVASIIEVNLEKLITLKPDVVLTIPLTDQKAKQAIKNLGIELVEFPRAKNFPDICSQMLKLGSIIQQEDKAKKLVQRAQEKFNQVKTKVKLDNQPKVFIQIGFKPLATANKEYFIDDLITQAGGINIASESPGVLYSREKVIELNPDIIIIANMGITGEKEEEHWSKYKSLSAVKKNKIYTVDSYKYCCPTLDNFVNAYEEIVSFFNEGEINSEE
ncbi:MAG: ABC transporter substrate-binding protein [Candidatus Omnitrophota bacterium]